MEGKALSGAVKNELWQDGGFTPKGVELIKKSIAKDATDIELQMFLHLCSMYQLDPFMKEIIFIKRRVWNDYKKAYDEIPTMMVSRDGFLSIAHKSGSFGGMKTVCLGTPKGSNIVQEYDMIPDGVALVGAKCYVWNKAFPEPVEQSVSFEEYCVYGKDGKPQALWSTKPETMIKKVAEAQALRKAFNCHGVYTQEEMEAEIARDSAAEIGAMGESLRIAESIHSKTDEEYKVWAEETMAKILDDLQACENEQSVHDVKRKWKEAIALLKKEDSDYINDMISNAFQNIVTGSADYEGPEDAAPEVLEEEKVPQKSDRSPLQPPIKNTVETSGEAPTTQPKASAAPTPPFVEESQKERFAQEWCPRAIKEIEACDTKAKLTLWKAKNIETVMSLLQEHRDLIKGAFKTQFDKLSQ